MSDYTPATEEVRAQYVWDGVNQPNDPAEFDRWLAEVKAQTWQEGYESVTIKTLPNPYRQGETE